MMVKKLSREDTSVNKAQFILLTFFPTLTRKSMVRTLVS